eukprot:COSAG02_NODE_586_length_19960_cov_13.442118_7_plen_52_part_00
MEVGLTFSFYGSLHKFPTSCYASQRSREKPLPSAFSTTATTPTYNKLTLHH